MLKVIIILFLLFMVSCQSPPGSGNSNPDNNNPNRADPNYDTDTLGIEWIDIPAGDFRMGDNFNEGSNDERPVHTVYLDAYKISKYEVTFRVYDKFCEEAGKRRPDDKGMGRGDRPVINVSWNDSLEFCNWLSQITGKNIHLPTEAQWEKSARGTDQRRYPWGSSPPSCGKANYDSCGRTIKAVGTHPPGVSPYGVHDMAGNVWEWCSDWFSSTYYPGSPGNNPTGASSGSGHAARGGGWFSDTWHLRSAFRFRMNPTYRGSNVGFRLCQD